ncbi:hypothetical protein KR222_000475 [Zaprionus bogoriensis]|nr:hypothetical protein KR222_000475 [Zaprionus bogoriensis]
MFGIVNSTYDKHERTWSGVKLSRVYDFDCSVGSLIHRALRNYPKNICQIYTGDGKITTNEELLQWSVRLAQIFKKRGLRHSDVIAIAAKNSTYVTPTAVACLFNATPFHAVNPTLDVDTLEYVFGITKPQIVFCDAADYEKLKTATSAWSPELITLTGKVQGATNVEELLTPTKTEMFYQPERLHLGGEQTMAILCSSGSTGKPKAVCLANHMLVFNHSYFNSEIVIYSGSSLDWYSGVVTFINSVSDGCTRIISHKPYSPEYFVELVEKYKISVASFAPRHVSALVACPQATPQRLASLFVLIVGGGWIPSETLQKVQKLLPNGYIGFGYGATEIGGISAAIYTEKLGNSVGALLPGYRAQVVDENGKKLGPGEVGELYVNHGLKWGGYYANPLETQRLRDSLGWFHTGDVGYFDDQNNLYIVDRKKEVYKCLGMQYWPNDIEVAIAELPDVQEVCVVGIYDEKYGDAPAAMVAKRPASSLSAEQIKQHVANKLVVEFKQLHGGVHFVDELPQTANGKVLRRAVREKLMQANLDR